MRIVFNPITGKFELSSDAENTPFTPAGNIAATNVQDAIEEVEAETGDNWAEQVHAATEVESLADTDEFGLWWNSISGLAKVTWAGIKSNLAGIFAALFHSHAATDITSSTLDGDRLPSLSAAKRGGVPATGVPSGLFLRDDDTWAAGAGYTDEQAQDAVGAMVADTATIDITYTDATPELKADVKDDSITNAKLAEVATSTIKGRVTAGTGNPEDLTVAQAKTLLAMQTGESVLGASFSITGTAGTYQDTGLSITLPAAGTYLISANVRAALTGNAGTLWWINIKLYNSTDAADVSNSERMCALTAVTAVNMQNTAPIQIVVTVAASKTIKLYAARNGSGSPSWTQSLIGSDSNGRTTLGYVEITK